MAKHNWDLTFEQLYDRTKQFDVLNHWSVQFVTVPPVFRQTGLTIDELHVRIKSIDGLADSNLDPSIESQEGAFGVDYYQFIGTKIGEIDITMTMVEFSDMAMSLLLKAFNNAGYDPNRRVGLRNPDLMWDINFIRANQQNQPTRIYRAKNLLLHGQPISDESMNGQLGFLGSGEVSFVFHGQCIHGFEPYTIQQA